MMTKKSLVVAFVVLASLAIGAPLIAQLGDRESDPGPVGPPAGADSHDVLMGMEVIPQNAKDEAEMTERAPLVLDGRVLGRVVMKLKDDPALRGAPDSELLKSDLRIVKWTVNVEEWIKGDSPHAITVLRTVNFDLASRRPDIPAHLDSIVTGESYRFWLEPSDWHNHATLSAGRSQWTHWIVGYARPV